MIVGGRVCIGVCVFLVRFFLLNSLLGVFWEGGCGEGFFLSLPLLWESFFFFSFLEGFLELGVFFFFSFVFAVFFYYWGFALARRFFIRAGYGVNFFFFFH